MMQHLVALSAFFTFKRDEFLAQRSDRGATAVEYGLMVALIAIAIIATVGLLGTELNTLFTTVKDEVAGNNTK